MAQDWDDILSEPIAQLQPDKAAAEGGWRAVRSLDEVSPRPQQPPSTMKDGESFLSLKPPVQAEDDQPASAKPPPSLTEQLSLTWANRRTRARPEPDEPPSPEPAPVQSEPAPPPARTTTWLQPLKRVISRLQSKPQAAETPPAAPVRDEAPSAPARRSPVREARPAEPPTRQRRQIQPEPVGAPETAPEAEPREPKPETPVAPQSLPLTLAQPPRTEGARGPTEETPTAAKSATAPRPVASNPPLPETPSAEPAIPAARPRPGGFFQRLIHRKTPAPVQQDARQAPQSPVATASAPQPASKPAAAVRPPARQPEPQEPPHDEGEALSPVTRARMEGLLDVPLRDVRIFRGTASRRLTQGVQADAVASGDQVHIAPHQGAATPSGEGLIAHELSHVAARRAGGPQPSPEVEERRAQVIEHAVQRRAETAAAAPAWPPAPQLTHRLTPQPATTPSPASRLNVAAPPASYSGPAFSPSPGAVSGGPAAIARAPLDRLPPISDGLGTAYSSDGGTTLMSKENPYGPEIQPEEPERDEAGLVDRVVDAVLRRMRRESALDRERRGVFRSEIGG